MKFNCGRIIKMSKELFEPVYLLRKQKILGAVPSAKEAYGRMLNMAVPSTIEALLSGLTGFVDTLMVSGIGITAVTAVGITTQPRMIILMLFLALNTGVTALVARRKGENDSENASKVFKQALLLSILLSVVMTVVGIMTARPLLLFSGAGEDFIENAVVYYRIVTAGTVIQAVTMTINAAQRGMGNTRIAMTTNIVSNIVNIVFNYILINGHLGFPKLGVKGAAIATVIGMIAAFIMACLSLRRSTFLIITAKGFFKFDKETVKSVIGISGNAALEELCFRIGFFMYNKIVAELGTIDYGTHIVCMNILNLSTSIGSGLGIGTTALVGQTMGEKRSDLSVLYVKIGQRIAFMLSFILSCIFIFGGKMLMGMFTDDPAIIENGTVVLIIMAVSTFGINSQIVYSGCLRGAGDIKFVAAIALISVAVVRPFLSYILCYPLGFGLIGAWIGLLGDQYGRGAAGMIRFKMGKWTKIKI
jgi:putative MATE family efflux protein